jgi:hypothetical protein
MAHARTSDARFYSSEASSFLNLKGAHKGDGSKEAKYRNKLQKKKHCNQTDSQARERKKKKRQIRTCL